MGRWALGDVSVEWSLFSKEGVSLGDKLNLDSRYEIDVLTLLLLCGSRQQSDNRNKDFVSCCRTQRQENA